MKTQKARIDTALRMLHPSEWVGVGRRFTLVGKDLHYRGDRSLFTIVKLLDDVSEIPDVPIELSLDDIEAMYRIGPDVNVYINEDITEAKIQHSSKTITIGIRKREEEVEYPTWPADEAFSEMNQIITDSVSMFGLGEREERITVETLNLDEDQGCIIMYTPRMLISTVGQTQHQMGITDISAPIKVAVSNKASVAHATKRELYLLVLADGNDELKTYVKMIAPKAAIPEAPMRALRNFLEGRLDENPIGDTIKASFNMNEFEDVMETIGSLNQRSSPEISVSAGSLIISAEDPQRRLFKGRVNCSSTGEIQFRCILIRKNMMAVIRKASEEGQQNCLVTINPDKKVMFITPEEPNNRKAVIMAVASVKGGVS